MSNRKEKEEDEKEPVTQRYQNLIQMVSSSLALLCFFFQKNSQGKQGSSPDRLKSLVKREDFPFPLSILQLSFLAG